jgi:hypothetical protein
MIPGLVFIPVGVVMVLWRRRMKARDPRFCSDARFAPACTGELAIVLGLILIAIDIFR